jgi:hypothetical protein
MKELIFCRAMGAMCRQRAAFYPEESWRFLAEAQLWEHRAVQIIEYHFADCNHDDDVVHATPRSNYACELSDRV